MNRVRSTFLRLVVFCANLNKQSARLLKYIKKNKAISRKPEQLDYTLSDRGQVDAIVESRAIECVYEAVKTETSRRPISTTCEGCCNGSPNPGSQKQALAQHIAAYDD